MATTRKKAKVVYINALASAAAKYWGSECEANPGTSLVGDYAYDIALKYGYKAWSDMPNPERTEALRAFAEGRKAEKACR